MSNKDKRNPQNGMGRNSKKQAPTQKAKDFKKAMKGLLSYLKPYRLSLVVVIIFAVLSSIFSIVGPKILGNATTEIFQGIMGKILGTNSAGINFEAIGKILLLLLVLYAISAVFSYIQSYIVAGIVQKMSYDFRKKISEKMNRMPLKYFDKRSKGDVLSILTNDVGMISENLNQSLTQVITSIVTLIGVLIMMFSISWLMTLVAIIILPLSGLLMSGIVKKSQKYFSAQQEYLGKVNGEVEEVYGGHNVVRAFNGEESAYESFEKLNKTLYSSAWKSQFLSGLMMPVMNFIGNLGYVLMSIFGGYLTILDVIQVGDILAFIQYIRTFMQPISQLTQVANLMQTTAAACERVFEFLDEEEEVQVIDNPVRDVNIKGNVTFNDVSFGYNEDKIIINDFTAHVKEGQRVAIVGPTGAGKTTIVKLLMRFYDLNKGSIMIDGHDITDFNRNDLRDLFGMVLQETWLYNGSIMENIRYGKLTASDEEVIEAAKAAHANHFIEALPDGYNMVLNEEASNISQGQKQLLTIARAILADPKILILDEATSSVDTRTEVLIQKAMDNLMKGRTSFIIAHRLSTIQDADVILVMKDGDIIEQGNHEELIAKNGFYASLYNSQFDNEQTTEPRVSEEAINERISEVVSAREPIEIKVPHEENIPEEVNEQTFKAEALEHKEHNTIIDERISETAKVKEVTESESNVSYGDISKFTHANNAIIRNFNVHLTDKLGNKLPNEAILKIGTRITVLHIDFNSQLVSIEYLLNNKVKKGFIKNDYRTIEYIDEHNYTNGYMITNVYNESNKYEKYGVLYPYEKATILYKENSKFCVVYDTEKGKNSKTGFVSIEKSRKRFSYAYNAVIINSKVALRDEKGKHVANKVFLNVGKKITVLWVDFDKQLALIEYLFNDEIKVGYIKNSATTIKYLNEYVFVNKNQITYTYAIRNGKKEIIGKLLPNEKFTVLYKNVFGTYIIYDTEKGKNSKTAFIDLN